MTSFIKLIITSRNTKMLQMLQLAPLSPTIDLDYTRNGFTLTLLNEFVSQFSTVCLFVCLTNLHIQFYKHYSLSDAATTLKNSA